MAVPKYPFPVVGGLERQSHELARTLVQRGHAVHAVSSRFDPGQHEVEVIDGVRLRRVRWVAFKPARFLLFPFGLARVFFSLKRDVDLVHVHNVSWFGAFVTALAKTLGLPVITKLPNSGDFGIPGMRRGPFGFLRIALLKRSDAIIAMTPESVAELETIEYPMARVLRVTNGIPLVAVHSSPRHLSTTVNAMYVGRLSSEKGVSDLLHAWVSVIARATRRAKLSVIGEGPQAEELRALTANLVLGHTVEFCGYRSDIAAELAKADLFVLPSYAEGNSNAILEAMSASLPIVATRVGGASLQLGDLADRFLVPPGDREALAEAIIELIDDEALRVRIGAEMRKRIETLFAIDRIAAVYEEAYRLILSGRRQQVGQLNSALFGRSET